MRQRSCFRCPRLGLVLSKKSTEHKASFNRGDPLKMVSYTIFSLPHVVARLKTRLDARSKHLEGFRQLNAKASSVLVLGSVTTARDPAERAQRGHLQAAS